MSKKPIIITLDGPAGVGKSTLAKLIAQNKSISYLDTGAMFRVLAFNLGKDAELLPDSELRARCMGFSFQLEGVGKRSLLLCNNKVIDERIRTEAVAQMASRLAPNSVVRDYLKEAQRLLGASTSLVAEGRDMGSVIFPDAQHKFFIDASAEIRAKRRADELTSHGEAVDFTYILTVIRERDTLDRNRVIAPLVPAEDAFIIDTSRLSIDAVLQAILTKMNSPSLDSQGLAFSHLTKEGAVSMINVGHKASTDRIAIAQAVVEINHTTLNLLKKQALPKGDVLVTAKLAGIMAAKQTANLIPLCHPVPLTYVDVRITVQDAPPAVCIEAETHTTDRTGVEMEAIIAAQVAAATIYDMCKAIQKDIIIRDTRLIHKSGGRSGTFEQAKDSQAC